MQVFDWSALGVLAAVSLGFMAIIYNAIGKLALRIDETNKRIDSLGTRIDDLSNDMRVGFQDIHRMFNEHLRREHHLTGIDT